MAEITAPQLMREFRLEVTVKGIPQLRFRLWLFKCLLYVAVWVGGFGGIEFVEAEEE